MAIAKKENLLNHVRVRVAPSPTGFPHVGTAFQALFNWVFSHRYQGQFLLRIEDTDQKRFVPEAEAVIFEALEWLGISPDESAKAGGPKGPYRQSERLEFYQKYAKQLIDEDKAYYCFCTPERLEKMRADQQAKGQPPMYDRTCRHLSKEEAEKRLQNGEKAVVRMKVPDHRELIVHDVLRGEVKFDSAIVDDQVLLKSDGYPTYHLAVVIDDHLMEITHMMRGEEWLSSAPKHVLLYEYFGWPQPIMIHTPILRNPDRSKLSKRKGNTSIWYYREQGFLKEALLNFLALLIWTHPEGKEIFSKEEMIKYFEWEQLNLTGPIFDTTKLTWINGMYIRNKKVEELIIDINEWASWTIKFGADERIKKEATEVLQWIEKDPEFFKKALTLAQDRLKMLSEVYEAISFYYEKELHYDQKDLLQKHTTEEISKLLTEIKTRFESMPDWSHETWDATIRKCAEDFGYKAKDLFMSLRSAITAREATPPLYDIMMILGKEESFRRINSAIQFINRA